MLKFLYVQGVRTTIVAMCGLLIVAAGAFGLATRMSYTDFDENPTSIEHLPYLYNAATLDEVVLSDEYADEWNCKTTEALLEEAPVVVEGTFEGDRVYGYQTFVSQVRITKVYRGDGINEQQYIKVFEPVSIRRLPGLELWRAESPDSLRAFYEYFDLEEDLAPLVATPAAPYDTGLAMMRPGASYLLFLREKQYPSVDESASEKDIYILENSPYARIALSHEGGSVEPVMASSDPESDFLSVVQAEASSFIAADEMTSEIYRRKCEELLGRLGYL